MPRAYVDNAYNRSVGRVGMPVGSCVISRGSSGGGGGISGYSGAMASYSGSSFSSGYDVSSRSTKTYVDNAYNRSAGRVGMPVGSCIISRGSSGGDGGSSGYGGSVTSYSSSPFSTGYNVSSRSNKTYVDNAYNRKHDRVGMPHGSMVVPSRSTDHESKSATAKTYVDNAYNRKHDRVGMPHGSMVMSSSSTEGLNNSGTAKTYVDNAYNRQHRRVGMPHGSMPVPAQSTENMSKSRTTKTYVDNAYNRRNDRVGLPHGSNVISSKSGEETSKDVRVGSVPCVRRPKTDSGESTETKNAYKNFRLKVYKDNPTNRRINRDGKPVGTMVVSRQLKSKSFDISCQTYVDNVLNRSVGRVGLPRGSQPTSRKSKRTKEIRDCYLKLQDENLFENPKNQRYSKHNPTSVTRAERHATVTSRHPNFWEYFNCRDDEVDYNYGFPAFGDDYSSNSDALVDGAQYEVTNVRDMSFPQNDGMKEAIFYLNRLAEEKKWEGETEDNSLIKTSESVIAMLSGMTIDFDDIKLGEQIGHGTFGDVYFAELNGTVVAVKILHVQQVSKRRLRQFKDEIHAFCDLHHPNIVRFIGACVEIPNLAIVMEYMQMTLFDALHMDDSIDFSDEERLSILSQSADGLHYLHGQDIAHCDMKSQNILLNYVSGETVIVKITDFGLSMMKNESSTSVSQRSDDLARNIGTPRYAAPEILRGERLSVDEMMMADIYSFALIMFEVLFEEEPFFDYTFVQLQNYVGKQGKSPEIPTNICVDNNLVRLMKICWDFDPNIRPKAEYINNKFADISTITRP